MTATLPVFSTNGHATRDIVVPGRSPLRPYGAIRILANVGQRREGDVDGLKACIAAGDVVIGLSDWECDALVDLVGEGAMLPCGGNVRFDCPRPTAWSFEPDGGHLRLVLPARPALTCCDQRFERGRPGALALGRHRTSAAHRLRAEGPEAEG